MRHRLFLSFALPLALLALAGSCRAPGNPSNEPGDLEPPAEVTDLVAGAGDRTVLLSWANPQDTDLDHVEITWSPGGHRRIVIDAAFRDCTVSELSNDTEYTFVLMTVDRNGNRSPGAVVSATPHSRSPLTVAGATTLEYKLQQVGAAPAPQSVIVGGGSVSWDATASEDWVVLSAQSGTAPTLLQLAIDPAVIPPEENVATVRISDADSTDKVDLTIEVHRTPIAVLALDHLVFQTVAGSAAISDQSVALTGYAIQWTASPQQPWIGLNATSGTTPSTLDVSVDGTGLLPGIHQGAVVFSDSVTGDTATLVLELRVEPHRLLVEHAGVALSSTPSVSRLTRSVRISENAGISTAWDATADQSWLVTTAGGVTEEDLVLTANPAGLSPDTLHVATVTVSSSDSTIASAETITVGLWVGTANPNAHDTLVLEFTEIEADPVRPYVYLHSGGPDIEIYNVFNAEHIGTISAVGAQLGDMAAADDGSHLYVAERGAHSVVPVELANLVVESPWALSSSKYLYLAFGRVDGTPLLFASNGKAIDPATGIELPGGFDGGEALSLSRNGRAMGVVTGYSPSWVKGYHLSHSRLEGGRLSVASLSKANTGSGPQDVAFSPDGTSAYTASFSPAEFRIFDTDTMTLSGSLPGASGPNCVELSVDDLLFAASATVYGSVDVWIYDLDGILLNNYYLSGYARRVLGRQLVVSGDGLRMIVATDQPAVHMLTVP